MSDGRVGSKTGRRMTVPSIPGAYPNDLYLLNKYFSSNVGWSSTIPLCRQMYFQWSRLPTLICHPFSLRLFMYYLRGPLLNSTGSPLAVRLILPPSCHKHARSNLTEDSGNKIMSISSVSNVLTSPYIEQHPTYIHVILTKDSIILSSTAKAERPDNLDVSFNIGIIPLSPLDNHGLSSWTFLRMPRLFRKFIYFSQESEGHCFSSRCPSTIKVT